MTEPKRYVGTKAVLAQPLSRVEYNAYRGWAMPENENPYDRGYLVEYLDGGKPNDDRHAGYISWSPAAQFEAAYRERPELPAFSLPWRQRVADELADLVEKSEALGRFLGDAEAIRYISTQALELLDDQHTVMARYQEILRARLKISDGAPVKPVALVDESAAASDAVAATLVVGIDWAKGNQPGPRVTHDDVENNIVDERFFTANQGVAEADHLDANDPDIPERLRLMTICVLTLRNGFTVLGTSTCVSAENFNAEAGRNFARDDALGQVYPLMGYALRELLHNTHPAT